MQNIARIDLDDAVMVKFVYWIKIKSRFGYFTFIQLMLTFLQFIEISTFKYNTIPDISLNLFLFAVTE